jgi:hypothetical protein
VLAFATKPEHFKMDEKAEITTEPALDFEPGVLYFEQGWPLIAKPAVDSIQLYFYHLLLVAKLKLIAGSKQLD